MRFMMTIATAAMAVIMAMPVLAASKCTRDSVKVGSVCMDIHEATVWRVPDPLGANKGLVKKIQKGKADYADLSAGGAIQLGVSSDDYSPCADNGQNCVNDIFAASIIGVIPSTRITWFQAQIACANSGKRLPTNAEWQMAVAGTPDGAPCNVSSQSVGSTFGRACESSWGAYDMVGNVWEWVADWTDSATGCTNWFGSDYSCLGGDGSTAALRLPGALIRGGDLSGGTNAGPFAVDGTVGPYSSHGVVGFRCAR
ncbi:MAG TPA: SUMF1/EgtB/PvdO family nonheme iron enzyme [Terriglobales bacterium]|nr:SUMF1/EgtB/PvdO family nonheme iron enzyme [Terriglobales bacterium]